MTDKRQLGAVSGSGDVAEISVRLAGVEATLRTDAAEFADYARVHLAPVRATLTGPPRVAATLYLHDGVPPQRLHADPELARMQRIDRDLYRGEQCLTWFRIDDFPGLQLRFDWDGERLAIRADHYLQLSKTAGRDWLKRVIYRRSLPGMRRRRFTTLLYYLLYYPCFWWLERHRDWHPIHAGGVEMEDGVVVVAGPSGVGKSTLVTALAASADARLLSDTFLLHRGRGVRSVPEPLLLDGWSQSWLGGDAALLRPIDHRYCLERNGFHWPQERLSEGGRIRLLLFPQRAPEMNVRPLSVEQAQGRIRAGDLIVNDLRRYWAYAAALELLDPNLLVRAREESLAALVSSVPIFEVAIDGAVGCADMVRLVRQLASRRSAA
jgi:hypothetical protein